MVRAEPWLSRGSFFCASVRTARPPASRNRLRIIDRQPSAYLLTRPYLQLPRPQDCQYGRYFELPSVRSPKYLPYFQSPPVRSSKYLPYFQSLPLSSSKYLPYWQSSPLRSPKYEPVTPPPPPPQSQKRTRHPNPTPTSVPLSGTFYGKSRSDSWQNDPIQSTGRVGAYCIRPTNGHDRARTTPTNHPAK